jgi:UDP-N-acetylmuramyl pentapeptide phosphotransferase/UDP-N-acetylglucosamine-1-phosphate transferase
MAHEHLGFWAAVVACGAALSAALILLLKPLLDRYFLAEPNARSSHSVATPQGAGLAVMLSILVVCAAALLLNPPWQPPSLVPVLAGAILLTMLGAFDDLHGLAISWRLIGQLLAAVVIVFGLPQDFQLFPDFLPLPAERALIVLAVVWFINAINFLDGLDWMTAAQIVPLTLGILALAAFDRVSDSIALLALALLGATLGFAPFNKHPAKVFLGDAGSLPIGLCLAFMLIFVAKAHPVAAPLLALYTLTDATLTLFRRAVAGEPILAAHRTHFYQRATAQGLSVPKVTARIFLLGLVLAGLAVTSAIADSLKADLICLALGAFMTGMVLRGLARGTQ